MESFFEELNHKPLDTRAYLPDLFTTLNQDATGTSRVCLYNAQSWVGFYAAIAPYANLSALIRFPQRLSRPSGFG